MAKALKHQDDLKANMVKFNTFVREKQLKADRGILVEAKEREMGEKIGLEISEKEQLVQNLEKVKVSPNYIIPKGGCLMMPLRICFKIGYSLRQRFLETAVAKKKKFREFLQSVVEDEKTHGRQEVV